MYKSYFIILVFPHFGILVHSSEFPCGGLHLAAPYRHATSHPPPSPVITDFLLCTFLYYFLISLLSLSLPSLKLSCVLFFYFTLSYSFPTLFSFPPFLQFLSFSLSFSPLFPNCLPLSFLPLLTPSALTLPLPSCSSSIASSFTMFSCFTFSRTC